MSRIAAGRTPRAAPGATTVEFALTVTICLVLMFATMELTRALYLISTVEEIVRRAARSAAVTDFSDAAAMDRVRQEAMFHDQPGKLFLGGGIDESYLRVSYSSWTGAATAMPLCPAENALNCTRDMTAGNCIRKVTVSLCKPGEAGCGDVPYEALMPLVAPLFSIAGASMTLPPHSVTVIAGSLGHQPGKSPSCSGG